MIIFISPNKHR